MCNILQITDFPPDWKWNTYQNNSPDVQNLQHKIIIMHKNLPVDFMPIISYFTVNIKRFSWRNQKMLIMKNIQHEKIKPIKFNFLAFSSKCIVYKSHIFIIIYVLIMIFIILITIIISSILWIWCYFFDLSFLEIKVYWTESENYFNSGEYN